MPDASPLLFSEGCTLLLSLPVTVSVLTSAPVPESVSVFWVEIFSEITTSSDFPESGVLFARIRLLSVLDSVTFSVTLSL